MLFPVILSGGFGGRLWPLSRASMPKQFISLITEHSLLQETVIRLQGFPEIARPTLACNQKHRFIAAEQLRQIQVTPRKIFLESIGRNTAPPIAIAALDILAEDPDGLMLVMPSDHVILDLASFHKAIREGCSLANEGYLVTFGIIPTSPKTGYGYIQKGAALNGNGSTQVQQFVEKPNLSLATDYVASKQYLWNSGIFLFRADRFLEECRRYAPNIYTQSQKALEDANSEHDFCWLGRDALERCPSDSIDYAIMEKTERAAVIPVNMGWSDVGSWGALWEVVHHDASGNVAKGNVFMKDVSNCYIKSDREMVATLGLDDLIIIDTEDALLVAHRDKEQEVKDVFKKLM